MIGDTIRDARAARGWTQLDLANASGISLGYIKQLEQDRKPNPTAKTLQKLARALNVPLDTFAGAPPPTEGEFPADEMRGRGLPESSIPRYQELWRESPQRRLDILRTARREAAAEAENARIRAEREQLETEIRSLKNRDKGINSVLVI